jgi:flavin reductase (DIM6/NTAB) family NADH-FMN oxidoreductase RutF
VILPSSSLKAREAYDLLTSLIVPRPIAWVSTRDEGGHVNLAPFSFFTGLGSDPPLVTLGISDLAAREGRPARTKDTLRIARETGVLCINLVEEHDAERMNASSGEYPPDVSEAATLGIETVPCESIPCVRIASSRAALECRLVDVHVYGRATKVNLVVAEVVSFTLDDALVEPGTKHASPTSTRPIARLGQTFYAKLGERFSLVRPRIR